MTALISKIRRPLLMLGPAVGAAALAGVAIGQVRDETTRYPYDPACAWGRLANGKGLIVRCLTRSESESLVARAPVAAAPPTATASAPADGGVATPAGVSVEILPLAVDLLRA